MFKKITMKRTHPLFLRIKKSLGVDSLTLDLVPGINVICGRNGSGKSTLFKALHERTLEGEGKEHFEFEIYNQQGNNELCYFLDMNRMDAKQHLDNLSPGVDGEVVAAELLRMWTSHGQQKFTIIEDMFRVSETTRLVMFDEPEGSLDGEKMIEMCKLLKKIAANGAQVIVISHHPLLVLNKEFNVVEIDGGTSYRDNMRNAISSILQ